MVHPSSSLEPKEKRRFRFVVIAIGIFFLFSVLILQYYKIQIRQHDKWIQIAKSQHQTVIKEPFRRGVFYSNTSLTKGHLEQKQPFVIDVLFYHLYVDPALFNETAKKEAGEALHTMHHLPSEMKEQFYKKSRSRRLAMWMTPEKKKEIECWWFAFAKERKIPRNALYFVKDYKRSYPFGKMLGQVLQTVREERDIETHQAIPTGGLEVVFNEYLQGIEGKKVILRAPRYELENDEVYIRPQDGADIYLTINHILQAITEEELAKGVEKVHAKGGWAVMMDPYTGEILALAHYPSFEPENYKEYYASPEKLEFTKNKAITDSFEPGSTMKPITIAIALKANEELTRQGRRPIFSPKEMIRTDETQFPGRSQPLKDLRTHKFLNMYLAIQKSSNIYPARLVQKIIEELGADWYRRQLVEIFGFGQKTNIELPYENPGLVPRPGKTYLSGAYEWSLPTPYSLAMGHNLSVNAIQLTRAYAIFANGGYLVEPTLVRKIVSKDTVILDNTEKRKAKKVLDSAIVTEITRAMKFTTKPGGSATLADVPGYTEAGKTGTAEKIIQGRYSKNQNFANFVGFVPATHPRFVLFVGIDDPEKTIIPGFGSTQFGGKCAAPVFREIAKRTLQYLGVPLDDPYGYPKNDPRYAPKKADWSEEIEELAKIYEKWNS